MPEITAAPIRSACSHCGMLYATTCPKIKAIEYYPDGTTKRIEFHNPVPAVQGAFSINPNVATTTGGRS